MARGYDDAVQVRTAPDQDPTQFLWQGRLYVVREVLGRWRERQAWWARPRALAVHGVGESVPAGRPGPVTAAAQDRWGGLAEVSADREVWRVEASAGRSAGAGVYDLCRETVDPTAPTWRLLRVAD